MAPAVEAGLRFLHPGDPDYDEARTLFNSMIDKRPTVVARAGSFRRNAGLRIDHIWVSDPLARRARRSWIDKEPRGWERPSDHTPVLVEVD
jgi:exodeoxyribonuclease-3